MKMTEQHDRRVGQEKLLFNDHILILTHSVIQLHWEVQKTEILSQACVAKHNVQTHWCEHPNITLPSYVTYSRGTLLSYYCTFLISLTFCTWLTHFRSKIRNGNAQTSSSFQRSFLCNQQDNRITYNRRRKRLNLNTWICECLCLMTIRDGDQFLQYMNDVGVVWLSGVWERVKQ